MSKIYRLFFCLTCLTLLDILITTFALVNGNQWNIFFSSFYNYSFTDSFIELWALGCLRAAIVFGGLIGVLYNQHKGPSRCKTYFWLIKGFAYFNVYMALAKLLAFSDGRNFFVGPRLFWFWGLFAWTFFGSIFCVLSWHFLCSMQDYIRKDSLSSENVMETQSLLEDNQFKNYTDGYQRIENSDEKSFGSPETNASFSINTLQPNNNILENKKSSDDGKKSHKLLNKVTIFTLLSYARPDWPWIVAGTFFLICASVTQVFLPFYIGKVITGIVVTKDVSNFVTNILIMAGISLLASACAGLRGGCFMITIQKLNIRVRNALFASVTNQEIGFFDNMKTGDLTSRLTSDTTTMSDTIGLNCNIFLRNSIKAIGLCVFMFVLSWRMSILTFMGLPLVFAVSELYGNYYKKWQKQVQDRFAIANEVAEEVCSSMKTVRSFANEDGERKRYHDKLLDVYAIQFKQAISYSGYVWSTQGIELMLTVATLWFGGHLLLKNNLSSQNFISFILYQEELGNCFSEFGEVYTGLMQALGAAEKVFELIKREPVIRTDEGCEKPLNMNGHISFQNVSFSYPRRPNQEVLKNVSFDVKPGEVVALVGPSGGGKSSCVKLLQRFYDPTSGSVLLDGIPVCLYDHKYLHAKVSMVGQEPVLYARSVRDNIVYGLDSNNYTDRMVLEASSKANCHEFIMELPERYETETGEKGTQLSGGQKQRIAIARAMVRNPSILLLDEATSALDTESEYLVQEALERSKSQRTVLLIAHRLSTVERADRIVVIVKGQVKEIGNHRELMERKGVYFNLVRRQLHGSDKTREDEDDGEVKHNLIGLPCNDEFVVSTKQISLSTSVSSGSSVASHMKI